ncbi:hypothetical protein FRC07_001619 [Ceratobasidium sp. 392]|nr:hypothetical protein FRC07_001619 [Ceratobasidium sp. 392]
MSQGYALFGLFFIWVTMIALKYRKRIKDRLPLPPSVKSDPLIGHLRYIPSDDEPRVYRDWGNELGSDIISMNVMGQVIIIVNSLETATELLARRSSIYSDRPELPMLNDQRLVGWGNNTGNIRYGDNWRIQRRLTHAVLRKKASEDFWQVMIKQTRLALQRLLDRPENFTEEFRRCWKRTANAWRKEIDQMVNVPYNWVKDQIAAGTATPSVVRQMLSQMEVGEEKGNDGYEERIRWATATLFAAMVLHPDIQARAQAEIDALLGVERLPEMTDRESLPYVCCIVKEVLRW